ncbi:MAG: response regulator [Bacteroidales bacterium]|nr:response regulator [Bacteroidales bacterium]
MTQLTINVDNPSILPSLKKILNALEGVSIATPKRKLTGIVETYEDIKAGRVTLYDSVEDMFKSLVI